MIINQINDYISFNAIDFKTVILLILCLRLDAHSHITVFLHDLIQYEINP